MGQRQQQQQQQEVEEEEEAAGLGLLRTSSFEGKVLSTWEELTQPYVNWTRGY